METVIRQPEESELEPIWQLLARSFNWPPEHFEQFRDTAVLDRFLCAFVGDEPAAVSRIRPFGQFFGGQRVAMGGFSPVGVAPEHRGRGLASRITSAQFPDLRERGEVLSALYPATTKLYRGVGFEVAGVWHSYKLFTRHLQKLPPAPGVVVRRATVEDVPAIQSCYLRHARHRGGYLDRGEAWWSRLLTKEFDKHHAYVVDGDGGEVDGYVLYNHEKAKDWGFVIAIHDLLADRPDVALALWRLIASSSTMARQIAVNGPPEDRMLLLLPEQDFEEGMSLRWMLRLIDVAGAMSGRGYRAAVTGTVDFDIADTTCDWNAGKWRLSVEGGKGELTRGGKGTIGVPINALAALYAGYMAPRVLTDIGLLRGASERDLDTLDALFAAPTPWMPDFF
jgi:predicted acetyltransferase